MHGCSSFSSTQSCQAHAHDLITVDGLSTRIVPVRKLYFANKEPGQDEAFEMRVIAPFAIGAALITTQVSSPSTLAKGT